MCNIAVAPLVGAWIEIETQQIKIKQTLVAPLVGAWIEILKTDDKGLWETSLLSWERGLKFVPTYQ